MTQRKVMTGAAALLLAATLLAGASGAQARTAMSGKHPKPSSHTMMHRSGSSASGKSTASKKGKATKSTADPIPAPGAITTPYPPTR